MANKTLAVQHESGRTVYEILRNQSGLVFDFSDNTWKELTSCTTPAKNLPWVSGAGLYRTTVDMALINLTGRPMVVYVFAYEQQGGSPAPATTDAPWGLGSEDFTVQFGEEQAVKVEPEFSITIEGSDVHLQAWLTADGQLVDLDTVDEDATCDVTFYEQTSGTPVFQVDDADDADFALSASSANHFELRKDAVIDSGHDDHNHFARVTITENGNSWSRDFPVAIHGGG